MNKKSQRLAIPEETGAPADDEAIIVERPDGFYWHSALSEKLYGPFPTLVEARDDAQYHEESDFEEGVGASLQEAEDELGASGWFDPGTGEFTEDSSPHLCDEM